MELNDILKVAYSYKASDIHFKQGLPPLMRVDGKLMVMPNIERCTGQYLQQLLFSIMNNAQKQRYQESLELDMAYVVPDLARFRVNVFQQRGVIGAVFRTIPLVVPTIEELGIPLIINKIAEEERGMILVTGSTGSGKSTTMAAIINYINII